MYSDIRLKIKEYTNEIISNYVKKGIYPSLEMIDKDLSLIDLSLPLYKFYNVESGEYLDADVLNKEQVLIYKDLSILYKIIYEISINEYIALKNLLDTELDNLEREANNCKKELMSRANSSVLGKTILNLKDGDFKMNNNLNHIKIDLGEFSVTPNSYLTLLIDGVNTHNANIVAKIGNYNLLPYGEEKNRAFIEGKESIKTHNFNFDDNKVTASTFAIPLEVNKDNTYIIYSGENYVVCKNETGEFLKKYDELEFKEETVLEFYAVGASSIRIDSNKAFLKTNFNFEDGIIKLDKEVQKIFIKVDKDTVVHIKNDSGRIYSSRSMGKIINDKLYCDMNIHNNKFIIKEISKGEKIKLSGYLKMYKDDVMPVDIKSITLKEQYYVEGDMY